MMVVAVDCPDTLNAVVGSATVQYFKSRLLGTGTYSAVYELRDASGTSIAAKVVPKARLKQLPQLQRLQTELDVHQMLNHEHIANFLGSCQDEKNVYMLMEPCTGATVYDIIKHHGILTEQQAAQAFLQVVPALQHMHQQGIAHRSLKLQHLQLDSSGSIKLTSFGTAAVQSSNHSLAKGQQQPVLKDGILADGWSLGMMLYTMLKGSEAASLAANTLSYGPLVFTDQSCLSLAAKDIIQALLSPNPAERPSLADVQRHSFVGQASPKDRWLDGIDLQQLASQKAAPPPAGTKAQCASPVAGEPALVSTFWPVATDGMRTSLDGSGGGDAMIGFFPDAQSDDDDQYYSAVNSFHKVASRDLGFAGMGDQLSDLEPSVCRMRGSVVPARSPGVLPRTLQPGRAEHQRRSSSDQVRSSASGQKQQQAIQQMMNEVQRSMHARPASGPGALDVGQRRISAGSSSLLSPAEVGSLDSWAAGPVGLTQSVSARGRGSTVFAAMEGQPPAFLPAGHSSLSSGTDAAATPGNSKAVGFSAGISPTVTPMECSAGLQASRNAVAAGAAAGKVPMPPQSPRPHGQLQAAAAAAAAEGSVAPAPSPLLPRHAYTSAITCPSPRMGLVMRQLSSNTIGSSGSSAGATSAHVYSPGVSPVNYIGRQTAARVAAMQHMPAGGTGAAAKVPSAFKAASDQQQQQQPSVPGSGDSLVKSRPVYRDIAPKLDEAQSQLSRSSSWQYTVLPAGAPQQQAMAQAAESAGGLLANTSSSGLSSSRNILGEASVNSLSSGRNLVSECSKSHLSGRHTLPGGMNPAPPLVPPSPAQQQAAEMRSMRRISNTHLTSPSMIAWAQRANAASTSNYNIVPSIASMCNIVPAMSAPGNIVISAPTAEYSGVSSWGEPVDGQQESFSMLPMHTGASMSSELQADFRDLAGGTNNSSLPLASRTGLLGKGQAAGGMVRLHSSDKLAGQSTDNILAMVTLPAQGDKQPRPPLYGQSAGDSNSTNTASGKVTSSGGNGQQPLPPKQMLPITRSPSVALRNATASPGNTPGRLQLPFEGVCSPIAEQNSNCSFTADNTQRRMSRLGGDGSRSQSSNSNSWSNTGSTPAATPSTSTAMSVLALGPQSSTRSSVQGGLPLPAFHNLVNFGGHLSGSGAGDDGSDDEGVGPAVTHVSMPNNIIIPKDQSLSALGPPSLGRTTSSSSYLQGQRSGLLMAPHPPNSHYPGGVMSPKAAPSPSIKARVAHGQHHLSGSSNVVAGVQHMMVAQTPRASSLSKTSSPGVAWPSVLGKASSPGVAWTSMLGKASSPGVTWTRGELSEPVPFQSPPALQAAPLGRRHHSAPPAATSAGSSSDAGRYALISDADADLMDSVQVYAPPLSLPGIAEAGSESACNTPSMDWREQQQREQQQREQQQQDERDAEPHHHSPPESLQLASSHEQSPVKKTLSVRKVVPGNFGTRVAAAAATAAGGSAAGKAPKAHAAAADRDQSPAHSHNNPATAGCPAGWSTPVVVSFAHHKGRLGYLMSSGVVGVIFEDSTHMITRDRWACYHAGFRPSQAGGASGPSAAAAGRPGASRPSLDTTRHSVMVDQDGVLSPDMSPPGASCSANQSSSKATDAAAAPPAAALPGTGPADPGSEAVVFRLPVEDSPLGNQASQGSVGLSGVPEHLALKANCLRRFVGCLVHARPYSAQCYPDTTKLPFPAAVEAHQQLQQGQLNARTVHVRRFVHREGCLLLRLTDGSHELVFTRDNSMLLLDPQCRQMASVTRRKLRRNGELEPYGGEESTDGSSASSVHGTVAIHSMLVPLDKAAPIPADEKLLAKALYASKLVRALQLPSSWQLLRVPALQGQASPSP